MAEDLLFQEEVETVKKARELVASGLGDVAAWIGRYDALLGQYQKLLSHTQRITRISDLMQNQINTLNERLTEANTFQAQLLQTAITGIVEMDPQGLITNANQAFCFATGFEMSELLGQQFREIFVPLQSSDVTCSLSCCPVAPLYGVECSVRKKDGNLLRVLGNSTTRTDASGAIGGGLVSIVDVTDLVTAREAAKAADKAKSDFLATMSHEIRTPLNAILGMIDLLLESSLADRQRRQVEVMKSSADSLIELLNDILDLSRIESGQLSLEHVDFSLRDSLSGTLSLLRMRASKKNLGFCVHIDDSVPTWLRGDPNRVRQVVLNLADNAIKFTGQGKVKISVEAAEQTANNVVLHFTVSDTGIGIAPDKLTGIFDRFYQADSSMTRRYGGSGLGLAIVAQLVKAMLGSVWAESEPQEGSVFHFTIRCEIGENPQRKLMHPVEEGSGRMSLQGLRVLLVEDSAVNQLVAREVLRRHGCDVMVASNGKEAVETVQSHAFDLILMDLQMPEMDGFEATRLIRQQKQFATIPIIAQTAHAFPQDIERCLGAGMDGHIAKPITPSGLLKVLSEHRDGLRQPQKPDQEASNSTLDGAQLTKRKLSGIDDLVGRLSDDKERAAQIIDIFLEVVPSQMADLDLAVLVGDCKAIGGLAHTIKGSFMSFGARELADLTMEIEKAAENDDLGSITVLTGRVNRQFAAFQEEVRRIRHELSP